MKILFFLFEYNLIYLLTEEMKYFVSVKTGDKMNAGTDSNVKLTIIGKSSLEFALDAKSSKKKKNLFEKGNLDEFEFESTDVGKVSYSMTL